MVTDQAFMQLLSRLKTLEHDLERTKTIESPTAAGGGGVSVPPPNARGDMLAADGTPVWDILALGAATGSVLSRNANDPVWSSTITIDLVNFRVGINELVPIATLEVVGVEDISHLLILADAAQSNTNPLILLENSGGGELLRIHSDSNTNVFIGLLSGNANAGGAGNTFVGSRAGESNTTGSNNTAIGYHALADNDTGGSNTAVGSGALGLALIDGDNNVAVGGALTKLWRGYSNVAVGNLSMEENVNAVENTACGASALRLNTVGGQNAAFGDYALLNVCPTSQYISSFSDSGADPGVKTTCHSVGHPLINGDSIEISGTDNYNGVHVVSNVAGNDFDITVVFVANENYGWWTYLDEGSWNTGIGGYAGASLTTGYLNTFLGFEAGYNAAQKVDAVNSMALGYGAYTTADNQVVIGNSSVTDVLIYGAVVIDGGGLTVNETGLDVDSRMEGDTLSHMLFLDASAATENIALLATAAPNWQTMDRGIFLGDTSTAPTGNPASGVFIYSEAGAAKCRGGGGTITTFGPSDPHCPVCGADYMLEWENEKYGYLSVCINCLTLELGEKPWILHSKRGNHGS
jgi:hypothetical protein